MPQESNVISIEQRRNEQDSTRFDDSTEFYLHEANPELTSLEEARARREALGAAAAYTKTPLPEQKKRLAEAAVEGIARSGAWIEYGRHDYLDRNWNLEDPEQDDYLKAA